MQCYVQYYWWGEGQEEKQKNKFRDYDSHLGERLMDTNQVSPTHHVLSSCCCVRYNRRLYPGRVEGVIRRGFLKLVRKKKRYALEIVELV